jgi:hypothetical protein
MAQGRSIGSIRGKEPILHKLVFELRYRYGFTYLDRCGRIANMILQTSPEWIVAAENVNPQNAPMTSLVNGCAFTYSALKLDFTLDQTVGGPAFQQSDIDHFVVQVDQLTSIVVDQLGLREFTRIGARAWYLFACNDKQEAETWLQGLKYYSVDDKLSSGFEGKVESLGVAVVISGEERKYRIAFNGVERQASIEIGSTALSIRPRSLSKGQNQFLKQQLKEQRRIKQNPGFAAMIDVDAFLDDPAVIDPSEFVRTSIDGFLGQLEAATR